MAARAVEQLASTSLPGGAASAGGGAAIGSGSFSAAMRTARGLSHSSSGGGMPPYLALSAGSAGSRGGALPPAFLAGRFNGSTSGGGGEGLAQRAALFVIQAAVAAAAQGLCHGAGQLSFLHALVALPHSINRRLGNAEAPQRRRCEWGCSERSWRLIIAAHCSWLAPHARSRSAARSMPKQHECRSVACSPRL